MSVKITELFPMNDLLTMGSQGYVIKRKHPTEPLDILNYTAQAQYDRAWNDVTRQTRGLIYHRETLEVVARPFPKFHNYAEHDEGTFDPSSRVRVTDKMDGSLGIMYEASVGAQIATRGSFDSEQARWANAHLAELYPGFVPRPGVTYLFEIIFKGNRIVVDYADREGLYLLAGVEIATGDILAPDELEWAGPRVDTFEAADLASALEIEPRPNAEGIVIHFLDTGSLVKVKQDDYIALHKLVTGLSEKVVWERMAVAACHRYVADPNHWGSFLKMDPKDALEYLATNENWRESIPEEFTEWLDATMAEIDERFEAMMAEALSLINQIGGMPDRRDQYPLVKHHPCVTEIMRFVNSEGDDASELTMSVWRSIRPEVSQLVFDRGEDVA